MFLFFRTYNFCTYNKNVTVASDGSCSWYVCCFSHIFKVFMQNKNDMWIEFVIIKIIRFFRSLCWCIYIYIYICCVNENMVSGKFFMQTFIKQLFLYAYICMLFCLYSYYYLSLEYTYLQKKKKIHFLHESRQCVFFLLWSSFVMLNVLMFCCIKFFFVGESFLIFCFLLRCKSNRSCKELIQFLFFLFSVWLQYKFWASVMKDLWNRVLPILDNGMCCEYEQVNTR